MRVFLNKTVLGDFSVLKLFPGSHRRGSPYFGDPLLENFDRRFLQKRGSFLNRWKRLDHREGHSILP